MLSDEELGVMYETNMILVKEHGFTIDELEGMLPFERQVYIMLVAKYLEDKQKALENRQHGY
jgi:hypothetical protein